MRYGNQESVVESFLPTLTPRVKESGPQVPLIDLLRRGLPMAEFEALQGLLDLPEDSLAPMLGISRATLHRRKKSGRLETPESERVVRFARLFGRAVELFESPEAAREWLKSPARGCGGETPLSYSDTEYGAREVEDLMGRIEHGVFS